MRITRKYLERRVERLWMASGGVKFELNRTACGYSIYCYRADDKVMWESPTYSASEMAAYLDGALMMAERPKGECPR